MKRSSKNSQGGSDITPLLARLEKWLATHRPRYLKGLQPGAKKATLDALEKTLGLKLPDSLRSLLAWHNGQGEDFIGCLEESWILMSTDQIAAAKPDLDAEAADTGWQTAWIPFLDDDNGNYGCLDTSQPEAAVREFWVGNADHPVVAAALAAWLEDFVTALERGDYREDPERGAMLRRGSKSN